MASDIHVLHHYYEGHLFEEFTALESSETPEEIQLYSELKG